MGLLHHSVLTSEYVRLKFVEETLRLHDIQFISPTFPEKLDSYSFKLLVVISVKADLCGQMPYHSPALGRDEAESKD